MKAFFCLLTILLTNSLVSQNIEEKLPYYEIPTEAKSYTAGTVAARMVDGLGFRFYWASNNLNEKDLAFKPNDSVRTAYETINHIYDLSVIIVNATLNKPNGKRSDEEMSYEELRSQTLLNLKQAADILRESNDISQYKIIFGDNKIPFWFNINGPIADAIWHSGQLASFRRSTGNPIYEKISHFRGIVKD